MTVFLGMVALVLLFNIFMGDTSAGAIIGFLVVAALFWFVADNDDSDHPEPPDALTGI